MSNSTSGATTDRRSPLQVAAMAVGATFLLVGILGFIPGITTDYGELEWAGHHSQAQLLGLFGVSVLHNVVHLAFGIAGVLAARTAASARAFLLGGGVLYLVLWLYGLVVNPDSDANFVPLDTADNWLHFVLGAGMIALGVVLARRPVTQAPGAGRQTGILE
ncbi:MULTISPECIES: DUF4383 domain-containing protein [Nocardia]|uniref:DUF4383 domain-containing protein n=1 Tax=Nocardia implantans TaxID=3108168 RepID=A0ABU6AV48_9NOCA|nr:MULTISPECIES: DUF4383 domain-containing protein [unclassified Nocardia]MBF6192437.1 DUF4383 domain-containing protein [Nocardia beijingensis]MEA3527658.1 DUF4383 domain-containing protein [Nocardia sp. CDC192]MEB3511366.1 DUF4383 domain-containing protein [Nocardia sp. CDC186]